MSDLILESISATAISVVIPVIAVSAPTDKPSNIEALSMRAATKIIERLRTGPSVLLAANKGVKMLTFPRGSQYSAEIELD